MSRATEYLKPGKRFASAIEAFNQLSFVKPWAKREATKRVNAIIKGMSKEDYDVFQDQILVDNLIANRVAGRSLREGFENDQQLDQVRSAIEQEAANRPAVQAGRQKRNMIVEEIANAAVARGLLPQEALSNVQSYMHQQVLMFVQAAKESGDLPRRPTGGGSVPRSGKAPFQKRRSLRDLAAEEYDFNTNYIESEAMWMADAMARIRVHDIMQEFIRKPYSDPVKEDMQKAAHNLNRQNPDAPPISWTDIAPPDGWELMPAKLGSTFFPAFTIPERIAAQLESGMLAEANISKDDLSKILALGRGEYLVLPEEIVKQIQENEARAKTPDEMAGKIAKSITSLWKIRALFTPGRLLGYRARQFTGDLDPLVGGIPGALKHAKGAVKDMTEYWYGKGGAKPDVEKAAELGVFNASWSFDEIPDLKDLKWFERFYESRFDLIGIPARAINEYFSIVKKNTNWQESLMRYAAYKEYLGLIREGKLENFGAGNKPLVQQLIDLHGPEVAAAHMSRRLLGDYANISVMGKWLRNHLFPFWSFQEINMQRYPRMAWNAATQKKILGMSGIAAAGLAKAIATSRLAWMLGGLWVWNNLLHGDEEDDLDAFTQQNPHIVFGRHPDGSPLALRSVGALGESMEWFGLNTAMSLFDEAAKGEISGANVLREMAADPLNKLAGMVTPLVKTPVSVISGQSYFPDPLHPRAMNRMDALAQELGLGDEYRAAKGKMQQEGSRARPDYWLRYALAKSDPRQNAIHRTYDLVGQWQRDNGKAIQDFHGVGDPYYRNMRLAAMSGDREAFREAFTAYYDSDKRWKNFDASMQHLDPLAPGAGFSKADRTKFLEGLTERQRKYVTTARDYGNDLKTTMEKWWREERKAQPLKKAG
jgi:hypothetical protein